MQIQHRFKRLAGLAATAMLCAAFVTTALAREPAPITVELSREVAVPGELVVVTFWFAGNGESSGFAGDFMIANPQAVAEVDLSGCLAGSSAAVGTCVHPGGNPNRVRILIADDEVSPLGHFSGTFVLTLAPDARPGKIPLVWIPRSWDVAAPASNVAATDGAITVAGVQRSPAVRSDRSRAPSERFRPKR